MNIVKTVFNCEVLDILSVRQKDGSINYNVCDLVLVSNHEDYKNFFGCRKGQPCPVTVRGEREDAQQVIIGQQLCYTEMNVMISAQEDEHVMQTRGRMPMSVRQHVAKTWDDLTEQGSKEVITVHSENLSPELSKCEGVYREVAGIDYTSRHMSSDPYYYATTPKVQ